MAGVLLRGKRRWGTCRREGHVKAGTEVGTELGQRFAGRPQKWGDKIGVDCPSEPPEETNHANTLTSDFWSPEL